MYIIFVFFIFTLYRVHSFVLTFFFFNDTATTEIYTSDTLFPYTTLFRSDLNQPGWLTLTRSHSVPPAESRTAMPKRRSSSRRKSLRPQSLFARACARSSSSA